MFQRLTSLLLVLFISLATFSQKKTLVKFEIPVGLMNEQTFTPMGQELNLFYPIVFITLHKHLDIGAGYSKQNLNYFVNEDDLATLTNKFFKGNIEYKATSFYVRINLSATQKRVNPYFGYILSFSKGTYTSPVRDSTSNYYKRHGSSSYSAYDYYEDKFVYQTRMTAQEEAVLRSSLNKSQMSHGAQLGIDFKIMPFLKLFINTTAYSVLGYNGEGFKKEQAFGLNYKEDKKAYRGVPMSYYMAGIVLKIDGGKKSLIK